MTRSVSQPWPLSGKAHEVLDGREAVVAIRGEEGGQAEVRVEGALEAAVEPKEEIVQIAMHPRCRAGGISIITIFVIARVPIRVNWAKNAVATTVRSCRWMIS